MTRFGSVWLTGFLAGPSAAAPVGVALRLPPWASVLALSASAWASFVIALFLSEWVRARWTRPSWWPRRRRQPDPAKRAARAGKARALLDRLGPAGFGLVGPALFGTWVSAVLGSALGLARNRLLAWLVIGATVWSVVLVLASQTVLGWLFA